MIAVIFEVVPKEGQVDAYLDAAALLRPHLEEMDGFISIERFGSLTQPGKLLSLSYWRDEEAIRHGESSNRIAGSSAPRARRCSMTTGCGWPR